MISTKSLVSLLAEKADNHNGDDESQPLDPGRCFQTTPASRVARRPARPPRKSPATLTFSGPPSGDSSVGYLLMRINGQRRHSRMALIVTFLCAMIST